MGVSNEKRCKNIEITFVVLSARRNTGSSIDTANFFTQFSNMVPIPFTSDC